MSPNLVHVSLTCVKAYWLGVVLVWGTFRLIGARNFANIPQAVVDDENQWTFGQLLPVLLLLSPVFNTFGLFLAKTHHVPRPQAADTEEMGSVNASHPSLAEPPKDLTRPLARSQISRLATMDVAPRSWTDRDYYSAPWMPACVGAVCSACFYLPGIAAGYLFSIAGNLRPQYTPFRFWVIDFGGLWFATIGLPLSTCFSIMAGIGLQRWFTSPSKSLGKQWGHYGVAMLLMATYTVAVFYCGSLFWGVSIKTDWQNTVNLHEVDRSGIRTEYTITFPGHIVTMLALTAVLYAIYGVWQASMYFVKTRHGGTQAAS